MTERAPVPDPPPRASRALDRVALQHLVRRLHRLPAPPWLHGEVAQRMAQRLPVIKLQPHAVADWSSYLGASQSLLRQAYPAAQQWQVQHSMVASASEAQAAARPWWSPPRWAARSTTAKGVAADKLAPRSVQLLWANMALHYEADIEATLQAWQAALAVDGFLMFSTLGPGSLTALRQLYAQEGWPAPFAPWVDMHDLGDMLVHAGFADPVMDQEPLTLTWPNAKALLAELRLWGANLHPQRNAGLRTPRWRQRLESALARLASADGRIALNFELVYGHAFKALPKLRVSAETSVAVEDLRAMARSRR